ncbi:MULTISPECIES: alpha/beta hydrolase [Streptomyces]|uniref:Alpha/beta hydrolase family protein n=1 Tax=Streptomyces koelreuteriae TaxID=2838015 RepID=A0ABX8FXC9_9ACTN|nr:MULTISPECIES: alpha/beta hydrolase [Streptomyces]QWB25868.1 alpha/beta hydrolase family protein [Streptomyces koelreuteriae]UUA08928.1 alpha/beta hydrolase family protein [Streptomyces koelreuteriae]UUA16533.1 alpha/beta hydrolase family protein [Streptomyces sp. CRCS-T-1]
MTSFDTTPQLNVWRALLALAVVFVMLATTGWTALRNQRGDTPLQASLSAWEHGRIGGHGLPDPETEPKKLARFFASLTAQDRASLVRKYPLAVGNMNGAPVELRYRANRVALEQARKVERERMHDTRLTAVGKQEAGRRMHRFEDLMEPGRHILAFDPEGSGRVAEVFGNLRRADRVSVVVPGVDTDLLTFQRTERKYSAPVGMAESLHAAERKASPSTRTAVIAWADYTAPSGLGIDSATAMRAAEGSVRLNALVRALPGDKPVSLFCHSYGSVVCGVAAGSLPSKVSDIAVAGSPGMSVEKAAQLHTGARVWAMRDADDWIQDVPYLKVGGLGHGADPVSSAFGARVLSAQGAKGHAGYFEPGTASLMNFAEIGVGAYRSVHCAHEDGVCRTGLSGTAAA